jgi:hypothetical protein
VDQRSFRDQLAFSIGFAVLRDPELLPRTPVIDMRVYGPFVQEDGLWRRC